MSISNLLLYKQVLDPKDFESTDVELFFPHDRTFVCAYFCLIFNTLYLQVIWAIGLNMIALVLSAHIPIV